MSHQKQTGHDNQYHRGTDNCGDFQKQPVASIHSKSPSDIGWPRGHLQLDRLEESPSNRSGGRPRKLCTRYLSRRLVTANQRPGPIGTQGITTNQPNTISYNIESVQAVISDVGASVTDPGPSHATIVDKAAKGIPCRSRHVFACRNARKIRVDIIGCNVTVRENIYAGWAASEVLI